MSGTDSAPDAEKNLAEQLGFQNGQIVQEFGYDDDVDFDLRESIEAVIGAELEDEDFVDVVDAAVVWWRDDDDDLIDGLVDALTALDDGGVVWLFTPKPGRDGYLPPNEISEAAPTAGLHVTSTVSAAPDWSGTRLVNRKTH